MIAVINITVNMVIDIKRANKKLMASNHSAMTSDINMIINLYHQGPGDRFATDFGGMRPFCRNIGLLSQQVRMKNTKKVGISS